MRAGAGVVLLVVLASGLSGCGVQLGAEHVTVAIRDGEMQLVEPADREIRAGEVVLRIENFTFDRRQVVLARTTSPPDQLPERLATALRGRDDPAVVAVSGRMRPAKTVVAGFLPTTAPAVDALHIHLRPGERYLLWDRLGGLQEGLALALEPVETD